MKSWRSVSRKKMILAGAVFRPFAAAGNATVATLLAMTAFQRNAPLPDRDLPGRYTPQ